MKRSSRISLVLMASISTAATVAACDGEPAPAPRADVAVTTPAYANKADCIADGNTDQACTQLASLIASAPQFTNQQSCEAQFGPQACRPQTVSNGNGGSSDIFMPMMMGYMLGNALSGNDYRYDRDYGRYANSSYYRRDRDRTASGYYNAGGAGYRAPVNRGTNVSSTGPGRNVLATPPRPVTVAPPVTQRGGFGRSGDTKAGLRNSASPNAINRGSNYSAPRATSSRSYGGTSRGGFGSSARGGFSSGG